MKKEILLLGIIASISFAGNYGDYSSELQSNIRKNVQQRVDSELKQTKNTIKEYQKAETHSVQVSAKDFTSDNVNYRGKDCDKIYSNSDGKTAISISVD